MVEFRTKVCTNFSACINQHNRTDSKSIASFTVCIHICTCLRSTLGTFY